MKKVLHYLPLLFILLFAQSCIKTTVSPNVAPVVGSWVLTETMQSTGNGWYYFNSGLEEGIFDFYNDGAAQYEDNDALMTGTWSLRTVSSGYYNEYGNYYNDVHSSFEIHVYDSYTRSSADLYFDDVRFTGNKIIATNYYGGVISKYVFRRY